MVRSSGAEAGAGTSPAAVAGTGASPAAAVWSPPVALAWTSPPVAAEAIWPPAVIAHPGPAARARPGSHKTAARNLSTSPGVARKAVTVSATASGRSGTCQPARRRPSTRLDGLRPPHTRFSELLGMVVESTPRVAAEQEPAFTVEHQHAVHPFDDFIELVLDDDDGVPPVGRQFAEYEEQFARGRRVEIGRRLVQHQ